VKFVNTHAYTEIVLRSCSFCKGAIEGWKVVCSNGLAFGFLGTVTWLLNLVLCIGIAIASAAIGHVIINVFNSQQGMYHTTLGIDIVVFVLSYGISKLFISVYGMSADVILHCYSIDEKVHDRDHRPPQAVRGKLAGFVSENKNNKENAKDRDLYERL